jgi:L-threonylcarbamoyladenylate synthase
VNEITEKACEIIEAGGVIIFPTETVYGIGASIHNESAIKRIFELKKRPLSKPLPVMISNLDQLNELASEIPESAKEYLKEWPGPLTLVFKKSEKVSDLITSGGKTVAIRMPDHEIALEIIERCGPIVATSANLSGEHAPVSAEEVKIHADVIIDDGISAIGTPSRIIDLSGKQIKIIRE